MKISAEKQLKLLAYKEKCGASGWLDQLQTTRTRSRKGLVQSWDRMKILLKSHFLQPDYEKILQQFQNCHQGHRFVSDYAEEFYHFSSQLDLTESESSITSKTR